jgi:mannose-6-phosphate isomerase-like protein (cupin superfamily)
MNRRAMVFSLALPLMAAEPAGYKYWSASQLLEREKGLASKMSAQKVGNERIADFGNHYALAIHREGSGQAELHQNEADIIVIQSGSATLVVGGSIPDAKPTTIGEIRGASVVGGTKQKLAPGDVVHVASKTPHQILLDPGQQLNYLTIKVKE